MKEIYFDNSATTQVSEAAAQAVYETMRQNYGNPSSLHRKGLAAEKALTAARRQLADCLQVDENELYFTSGGTESDNLALTGICGAYGKKGGRIITSAIEHPAVLETVKALQQKGFAVDLVKPGRDGRVAVQDVAAALRPDTLLVSLMQVNNETGAVQPLEEVGRLLGQQQHKIYFHVDGVQGFGKQALFPKQAGIDLYAASAHKIHGPKGMGLLYCAKGLRLQPIVSGGGQEKGLRSGTENMPGIVGFGVAATEAFANLEAHAKQVAQVRQAFCQGLSGLSGWQVNSPADGLPYVLNISFEQVKSEVLLHYLEDQGVYVSSGSACAAKKDKLSHVLTAMGLARKEIEGAIRFSFSRYNTVEEAQEAAAIVRQAVTELRQIMR